MDGLLPLLHFSHHAIVPIVPQNQSFAILTLTPPSTLCTFTCHLPFMEVCSAQIRSSLGLVLMTSCLHVLSTVQRSRTLPGKRGGPTTIVTVEDIEDEEMFAEGDEGEEEERNFYSELPLYRQTTRRLKERMDIQLSGACSV